MSASRILPSATGIRHAPDGTLYARNPHPLGSYPDRITERLHHWAERAPARVFLARRDGSERWRHVTYGRALTRVRSLAQALLDRGLSAERPLVILSGNSIEHALLGLAAMYSGIPYAPIAPAYSLLAREYTTLRALWASLRPGLVFAAEADRFVPALAAVAAPDLEIVGASAESSLRTTPFDELEGSPASGAVDDAHARVGPDTIAKILFTSGSTGRPKGVVNTQRMLCSNQEMLRTVLPILADPPPVLCDWLPWNHTFGGNHNFGIVLYNGGTLYIDDGRPTADGFATTLMNLREVASTAYFNVPRGYDLLVPCLDADAGFAAHFFSRLEMLFCAAASLRQRVADDLTRVASRARGERIPLVTGLGATESAPFALCAGDAEFTGGRVGVPVPGVELKLAPVDGKLEGRLRGPSITPGYWRDTELTRAAFDEEGFYRLGDALGLVDRGDPSQGFVFEGRLSEDFKLSTGTWVRVGPLRAALLAHLGDLAHDVVIAGHDRAFVSALIFPNLALCPDCRAAGVRERFAGRLAPLASMGTGSSTTVRRAVLLDRPPAIDAHELTDKGSVNQKAVLANRAAIVDALYAAGAPELTIDIVPEGESSRAPAHSD
jgi:feruloyl-CoA synthase